MTTKVSLHNSDARIEAKSDSSTNGFIEGYAAIWGVKDLDGDIITKGAFTRAISNQINAGKVPLMVKHFRDGGDATEVVGQLVEAREDDIGFWVRAKLIGTGTAQDLRAGVREAPAMYGMSVGWRNVEGGFAPLPEGGFEFTEMNLKEVTITMRPAQEDTVGLMQAKSEDRIARLERAIEELRGLIPNPSAEPEQGEKSPSSAKALDDGEANRRKRVLAMLRR